MVGPSHLRRAAWQVLARTPAPVRDLAQVPVRRRADAQLRALAPMPVAERRLYLGPLNTAGQAWEWARAAEKHLASTAAQNLWAQRILRQVHFGYPADHEISLLMQRGRVREVHGGRVLSEATHVLFESGRPVLSNFHAGSMLDDVPALEGAGIAHAVLWHGSEIRDLHAHAERFPHSPFREEWDDYFRLLQGIVHGNRESLERYAETGSTVFVSTPDLLDLVPGSTWLPLVVDVERFASTADAGGVAPLERERPVVLHAPSNSRLKGGRAAQEQLTELDRRGLVEYRYLRGVPHDEMAAAVADADIVLDQFALGATGVFAAECLAAGRVVVAHLAPHVRERMADADRALGGAGEVPVVEAGPGDVGAAVERIVAERGHHRELARSAREWSRRHHDGRAAAAALRSGLLGDDAREPGGGAGRP